MNKHPLISVIMGIYNCAETLPDAIDCIINQTYENWELVMCDDGSKDDTYAVALEYKEKYPDKIRLIKNDKNCGLNRTLNNCLAAASGEYIARMDGDDLCSPVRFEKQIDFLLLHTEYDIVSTNMEYFDDEGIFGRSRGFGEPKREDIAKGTPFCHAPCMVSKKTYDAVGGYSEEKRLLRVEDYDLWIKMYAKGYRGYNLPDILYSMRDDRNAVKRRKYRYRINEAYVKIKAIKLLKLSAWNFVYVLKPLVLGLLPTRLYVFLHKNRLNK